MCLVYNINTQRFFYHRITINVKIKYRLLKKSVPNKISGIQTIHGPRTYIES